MTKINHYKKTSYFDIYVYFDSYIGFQYENLEIHGSLGLITHAVRHVTPVNGGPTIDRTIEYVPSLSVILHCLFSFNIFCN